MLKKFFHYLKENFILGLDNKNLKNDNAQDGVISQVIKMVILGDGAVAIKVPM